ncbi:IS66 family transposase zinc-finger binding domain-containing protein [Undibacterium sp. CCC3.4]|uniref:IS66 family transposase zinc-finger binding domain-containing protein n=1 Tax=unclassified Undibacterium TaxID=2630295 RepID=UPI003A0FF6F0
MLHDIPAHERTCPCGTPMVEIGADISEQLDIVPMQVRVLRHIRKRYGCPGSTHAPVTAALPPQPLPKSNASADFLAMLLTTKYVDGLPLARFECNGLMFTDTSKHHAHGHMTCMRHRTATTAHFVRAEP